MTYKKLIPILLLAFAQTACLTSTPQNFNFDSVPVVDPSTSDPQISENENTASDSQTRKLPFSSIDAIELSHTEMTLKPNQRARLILQNVFLENGARYKKINSTFQTPYGHNESVLWISGDSSVTEIDSEGFLNAKSPGIAIVSAQLGEITAFAQITVLDFEISSPTAPLPEDAIPDEEEQIEDDDNSSENEIPTDEPLDDQTDNQTEEPNVTPVYERPAPARFLNSRDQITYRLGPKGGFGESAFPQVLHGAPKSSRTDVLSLGLGGQIIIEVNNALIKNKPGADFTIFENPFSGWLEPAFVEVSSDGETFYEFDCRPNSDIGSCAGLGEVNYSSENQNYYDSENSGGDSYDLSDVNLDSAKFIRITDANTCDNAMLCVSNTAGFDLDAVALIHLVRQ